MITLGRLGVGTAPIGGLYETVEDETAHAFVERRLGVGLGGKPCEEFAVSTKVGRPLWDELA
jgi:aryl-alcohol dehydrogenase-like predicted oxidoreductase